MKKTNKVRKGKKGLQGSKGHKFSIIPTIMKYTDNVRKAKKFDKAQKATNSERPTIIKNTD